MLHQTFPSQFTTIIFRRPDICILYCIFCILFGIQNIIFNLFCHAPRGQRELYMLSPGHACGACNHHCSLFHCVATPLYRARHGSSVSSPVNEKLFELFKPAWVSGSRSFIAYYAFWPFGIFFLKKITYSWIFLKKLVNSITCFWNSYIPLLYLML